MTRIVLAYSGGDRCTAALPRIAATCGAEVITLTVDVGQGGDLNAVRERALSGGAVNAHVLDARQEFASSFVLPALQAGAVGEGGDPQATALSRPLIASKLAEIARIEGASAVAHACRHDGDDRLRFERSIKAVAPEIRIVVPPPPAASEEAVMRSRTASGTRRPGVDASLWGRTLHVDGLSDPWGELPAGVFSQTEDPSRCPARPATLDVEFSRGVPVAVNGVPMGLIEVFDSITTIAGNHGVGRIDSTVTESSGVKSRVAVEAPAAVVLLAAHRELLRLVIPADLERLTSDLAIRYADLVDRGEWFSPTRNAIDALVAQVQPRVTGTIRFAVSRGCCRVVARRTPFVLDGGEPGDDDVTIADADPAGAVTFTGGLTDAVTRTPGQREGLAPPYGVL